MAVREFVTYHVRNPKGNWLAPKAKRSSNNFKYSWANTRDLAVEMTYDQAQKARQTYGGQVVKSEITVVDKPLGDFYK